MSARRHRRAVAVIVLALAAAAASAETIYRCGDSYSQSPCANARTIEVVAPPTEAQRAEARAVATRERQLALGDGARPSRARERDPSCGGRLALTAAARGRRIGACEEAFARQEARSERR